VALLAIIILVLLIFSISFLVQSLNQEGEEKDKDYALTSIAPYPILEVEPVDTRLCEYYTEELVDFDEDRG